MSVAVTGSGPLRAGQSAFHEIRVPPRFRLTLVTTRLLMRVGQDVINIDRRPAAQCQDKVMLK